MTLTLVPKEKSCETDRQTNRQGKSYTPLIYQCGGIENDFLFDLYQTIQIFINPEKEAFWKYSGKRRKLMHFEIFDRHYTDF